MNPLSSRLNGNSLSRRTFFRVAAGASAAAGLRMVTEPQLARAATPHFTDPDVGIHIDANENPMGPCEAARKAIVDIIPRGGRYLFPWDEELGVTFARQEGIDPGSVLAFAGSTEPLTFTVTSFTGKNRPLVTADPGYEAPVWAARDSGAPVVQVPLADPGGTARHDIKAMLAAAPNPGVIYICNPNNPTGTPTPHEDIEYAVTHASGDTIILIDEAYIHFCGEPRSLHFVKEGRNVIVLRTFSKIYGMAGLRMGFAIGRPDLLKKIASVNGENALPVTALVAATASLRDEALVATRKKAVDQIRQDTTAWLNGEGFQTTPSVSNCFMVNVKRPGGQVQAALAQKLMFVGRIWPAWPHWLRITVGTSNEMKTFRSDFKSVMATDTAALAPLPLPARLARRPFTHLS
ncbi:MAG TPA: pyridoxal phosphate-dependent aminotransferase [Terracidiphilus sp.]|nr:pyridoxal phosphate-dependent aminotransferase [Terracidiphilus sp.]